MGCSSAKGSGENGGRVAAGSVTLMIRISGGGHRASVICGDGVAFPLGRRHTLLVRRDQRHPTCKDMDAATAHSARLTRTRG